MYTYVKKKRHRQIEYNGEKVLCNDRLIKKNTNRSMMNVFPLFW